MVLRANLYRRLAALCAFAVLTLLIVYASITYGGTDPSSSSSSSSSLSSSSRRDYNTNKKLQHHPLVVLSSKAGKEEARFLPKAAFQPPGPEAEESHRNTMVKLSNNNNNINNNIYNNSKGNKCGYVMAAHFTDQLTAGSVNLLSLQCWAESLLPKKNSRVAKMRVVEPFLRDGSYWGLEEASGGKAAAAAAEAMAGVNASVPRLRDVFDATAWSRYSKKHNSVPLVNWEEFLKKAPRRLILAGVGVGEGRACTVLPSRQFQAFARSFARANGFEVVREVCTTAGDDGGGGGGGGGGGDNGKKMMLTSEQFRLRVYGENDPIKTVVLFDRWPGIADSPSTPSHFYRIPISDQLGRRCGRKSPPIKKFMDVVPLSKRLLRNGHDYVKRFLPAPEGFVAIMFRVEQLFVRRKLFSAAMTADSTVTSAARQLELGSKCIRGVLREVEQVKQSGKISQVFLAMDSGKFGSSTLKRRFNKTVIQTLSHELFSGLYGAKSSLGDWEDSFLSVADFTTPGYVAMLQLNVAVRGAEVILAGGGSFQSIAEREIASRRQSYAHAKVQRIREC